MVLGAGAVGVLTIPVDAVVLLESRVASGTDFLMSLCDFRAVAVSLLLERVLGAVVVVVEESCARSCPNATNGSAPADVGIAFRSSVKADTAASDSTCPAMRSGDSKCFMDSSSVTASSEQ